MPSARWTISWRSDCSWAAFEKFEPPNDTRSRWKKFCDLFETLADPNREWRGQIALVREWYKPHMERMYEHVHTRIGDLDQLELLSSQYPTRERFVTELTLDPPNATERPVAASRSQDEDYLVLSTIHSAKGMEWDNVLRAQRRRRQLPQRVLDRQAGD